MLRNLQNKIGIQQADLSEICKVNHNTMKVTANWKSALAFEATSDNGHTVTLDTTVAGGGLDSGMSPKKMLLAAVCGCSGMDVVDILNKMKVPFTRLTIDAEAEQTEEVPKVFTHINLVYHCDVSEANFDKLKRAVELSMEKYCGVSIMLKKHCPVNYTVNLL
jgi:putative redox protein